MLMQRNEADVIAIEGKHCISRICHSFLLFHFPASFFPSTHNFF